MLGLMQARPLTIAQIFERAEGMFRDRLIVTATGEGDESTSYGEWAQRVRRLAAVLDGLGASPDARIGTLATNTQSHLEAYFAVPLTGRILHTVNIRLAPNHLEQIIAHAGDEVLLVDRGLMGMLWPLAESLSSVRHWIVMADGSDDLLPTDPRVHDYELLLGATPPREGDFVIADENTASGLCYTSGTTGDPKGVLYSHRSTMLQCFALLSADVMAIGERDTVLPIVPMFHVNAWALPYAALLAGAKLVLPGAATSPAHALALISRQRVTVAAAATTVWNFAAPLLENYDLSSLRMVLSGGSATSVALSETWRITAGVPITHSWGMTEISPMAVIGGLRPGDELLPVEEQARIRSFQGRPLPFVDIRIVQDDREQPWDGESIGEVQVAGPWVLSRYYGVEADDSFAADGWLRTGDLGTMSPEGYLRIVDRAKDVIKSGGEWISSVQLENAIMAHPDISEAAVVGRPDDKWAERPVAFVVARDGRTLSIEDIHEHLRPLVAKWWLPEDILFVEAIPKTGSGKFSKPELRAMLDQTRPPR
ncbi:MAG: long-chain fatty acid--CoA ligase [Galbitalea sp.]